MTALFRAPRFPTPHLKGAGFSSRRPCSTADFGRGRSSHPGQQGSLGRPMPEGYRSRPRGTHSEGKPWEAAGYKLQIHGARAARNKYYVYDTHTHTHTHTHIYIYIYRKYVMYVSLIKLFHQILCIYRFYAVYNLDQFSSCISQIRSWNTSTRDPPSTCTR